MKKSGFLNLWKVKIGSYIVLNLEGEESVVEVVVSAL